MNSTTHSKVEHALSELIDPEAGMNVIDLGLLHEVRATETHLHVELIPTTAGCPLLHSLTEGALFLLQPVFPKLQIDIQWRLDIDWTPDRIRT